jgi:hypothetical protein
MNLSPDPSHMRVLEGFFALQAVAESAVKAEMGERSQRGVQSRKEKERKGKHQEFFEPEECFHEEFLWISTLRTVGKLEEGVGKLGLGVKSP